MAEAACLLCGDGSPVRALFTLQHPILQCGGCGLVYAQPAPGESGEDLYTERYYRGTVYPDYLGDRPAIRCNARRALAELEGMTPGRRLLDVGCATGFYLEAARERGWTVRGLEVSQYASDYARRELGLPVDTASILSPPPGLPSFDAVTLWDLIEHIDRPDVALAQIHKLLVPGGVLALSTADFRSVVSRLTGKRWRIFADPTHRFFFDARTIRLLLSRAGFEVVRLARRGKWVGLSMALHQSPLPGARRIQRWLQRLGWRPSVYVNLWDMMTVVAKPADRPEDGRPAGQVP